MSDETNERRDAADDPTSISNEQPTRVDATPTPPPTGTSAGSDPALPFAPQDLLSDGLLATAPRVQVGPHTVPALGDISLISKLGHGGMGAVYLGYKPRLRRMVAVKVLPLHLIERQPQLAERFLREAQIAASIESPHLVRVTDVADQNGLFFLVMEYVDGATAGSHLKAVLRDGQRLSEAAALDIIIAATRGLAVAHAGGVIHRDVKPDNILIPRGRDGVLQYERSKLSDLGLARSEEAAQSLTGTDIGMGTPGYMAPEQALSARTAGKPADVFSMGATLYALLGGHAPFRGESSTAVVMATIQQAHVSLSELREDVTPLTVRLVDVCLSKSPGERFVDASSLLEALLHCRAQLGETAPSSASVDAIEALRQRSEVGAAVPLSAPTFASNASAATSATALPKRRIPSWQIAAIVLILLAAGFGYLWKGRATTATMVPAAAHVVSIGVGYSSEKQEWLTWAADEFRKTADGANVTVELLPLSERDAETALASGDRRLNVWAPASSLYRAHVEAQWRAKHDRPLIAEEGLISLTPQVFVMFDSRYAAFRSRYGELNFKTLQQALSAGTWEKIAARPDWGDFKFAITDPARYNNGLAAVTLMAAEYHGREEKVAVEDVQNDAFRSWLSGFRPSFDVAGNSVQSMRDLVLKGPSSFDGVFTYESTALSLIDDAEDRWESATMIYPRINLWNDARFYVLDVPWSSDEHRQAARAFMRFLLSRQVQEKLVTFGLRPVDPDVRIRTADSPFVKHEKQGTKIALSVAVQPPAANVVEAMIADAQSQRTPQ